MEINYSEKLFGEAKKIIPGGVNSPVRAFKSVGGTPRFIKRGWGSRILDVDGNEYIDLVGSWGPHLFGHIPKFVKDAIAKAVENGTSFGAPTVQEINIARFITQLLPSMEMVRMVNSGTEATMSAIRLARAYTSKDKIVKFAGCYHGHFDSFLVGAGSGPLTFGVPNSPGVTQGIAKDTLVATYNDLSSVEKIIDENKGEIAAIIVEPVAGNMGVIPPKGGFLQGLRQIADSNRIVLIFDEVITGFRLHSGGAQALYGVKPDLTTLGKIIGGGLPAAAFGGRKEIMELLAPVGPVYQAGTLSGNPLAVSAGVAVLKYIKENPNLYQDLESKSKRIEEGILDNLSKLGKKFTLNRVGSMMTLFFTENAVFDLDSASTSDTKLFAKYFHKMLEHSVYLPCSQFEAFFVPLCISNEEINFVVEANYQALKDILQ